MTSVAASSLTKSITPLISVLMNCYNSERYLKEAIQSVVDQSYENWEIVFWDNQSTDSSREIVFGFNDPRIRYFYAPKHTPLGEARNLALKECLGEWTVFLDCDDLFLPKKLESHLEQITNNPSLVLLYSDIEICNSSGELLGNRSEKFRLRGGKIWGDLLTSRNFIPCCGTLFKTEVAKKLGGFKLDLKYAEEYELFLRLLRVGDADYLTTPLARFRLHGSNITGFGNYETTRELLSIIISEHKFHNEQICFKKFGLQYILFEIRYYLRVALLYIKLWLQRAGVV